MTIMPDWKKTKTNQNTIQKKNYHKIHMDIRNEGVGGVI